MQKTPDPVPLRPVGDVAAIAAAIVARFQRDVGPLPGGAEVHHVGATALGTGRTKADVDVNVRVDVAYFDLVVQALQARFAVAQPENWTPTFASFATDEYALPFGIQVTAKGSEDDFLLELHERLRADPELRRRYDDVKSEAAPHGAEAYWQAKDAFLRELRR